MLGSFCPPLRGAKQDFVLLSLPVSCGFPFVRGRIFKDSVVVFPSVPVFSFRSSEASLIGTVGIDRWIYSVYLSYGAR